MVLCYPWHDVVTPINSVMMPATSLLLLTWVWVGVSVPVPVACWASRAEKAKFGVSFAGLECGAYLPVPRG